MEEVASMLQKCWWNGTIISHICLSFSLVAVASKYYTYRAGLIFLVYGIIGLLQEVGFLPRGLLPYSDMGFSLIGSVLFSFYLAHHTKLIVGGKHAKYQMNDQDYVFGAMALYNDIINMFIYILRILGEDKNR